LFQVAQILAGCYNIGQSRNPQWEVALTTVDRPRSLRRLTFFSLLTVVGLIGLLLDVLMLGSPFQEALPSPRAQRSIPDTDLNPYGVNVFLDREPVDWKIRHTMQMIADAKIGWVKQQFSWAEIEPQEGVFWDYKYDKSSWDKFDRIVDLAEEYGLEVIARVDRPPDWARPEGSNPEAPPFDPHTYADFIYQFVQHYRGRIHYIQIWNEPNLHTEWREGAPVDARSYVRLLQLAYERAKEADPNIRILCAPLAVNTRDDPNRLFLSELTYLEEMYRAGAASSFDIMSANAYGFDDPPEAPPDPGRLNFRRVELLRLVMEEYGDRDKAIWFNEYGWNAAPVDAENVRWGRVSEAQQAEYTVQGIEYAREHWPWAGVLSIWYFRQEISRRSAEYYFGMVNEDFTPKPVYTTVKDAVADLVTASPGWYEELAAPIRRWGDWQPTHDPGRSGYAYLASSEPGNRLTLTFLGSDLHLLVRRGPDGGRLVVSVDGISGRGTALPRDDFGQAYLDLYSPKEEWVTVPLVQGLGRQLPPQAHRLELIVSEERHDASSGHLCALDAFEVEYRRSYVLFGISTGLLFLVTVTTVVLLVQEARRPAAPRPVTSTVNPWTLQPGRFPDSKEENASPPAETP
jgi:hypothetical protein